MRIRFEVLGMKTHAIRRVIKAKFLEPDNASSSRIGGDEE